MKKTKVTIQTETYAPKPGAPFGKDNAQEYGEYLTMLSGKHEGITPSQLVKESKLKRALLHDFFEWDDTVGGVRYREQQARNFINHFQVEVRYVSQKTGKEIKGTVDAFPNIRKTKINIVEKSESKQKYLPVEIVLNDADYTKEMILNALRELNFWKNKYSIYSEFAQVFRAIDDVSKKLVK